MRKSQIISPSSLMVILVLMTGIFLHSCNEENATAQDSADNSPISQKRTLVELKQEVQKAELEVKQAKDGFEQALHNLQIQKGNLADQQLLNTAGVTLYTAAEPGGTIKVYNSTFNELVDAIEPISRSGSHPVTKRIRVCIPFTDYCYSKTVTVCGGNYTADVKNTAFSITTSNINISSNVSGIFKCILDLPFNAALNTTGNATYNSNANAIFVTTNPTSLEPCVHVPVVNRNICLGFTVNVAPTLSYKVPVTTASLFFETADGQKHVRVTPKTVNLTKRTGYIEISSDVHIW